MNNTVAELPYLNEVPEISEADQGNRLAWPIGSLSLIYL